MRDCLRAAGEFEFPMLSEQIPLCERTSKRTDLADPDVAAILAEAEAILAGARPGSSLTPKPRSHKLAIAGLTFASLALLACAVLACILYLPSLLSSVLI